MRKKQRAVALLAGTIAFALSSCVALSNSSSGAKSNEGISQWIAVPKPSVIAHQMPEVPTHLISFETTEGTLMSVDVSTDGETLVFDLLGDIYLLPLEGGAAVPLTAGTAWDQAPRFSPDGAHVYFVSDREGYKNLWRFTIADKSVRQITRSGTDILGGPNWSQYGSTLLVGVANADRDLPEVILHSINPISGAMTSINAPNGPYIDMEKFERLRSRVKTYSGVEAADGKIFFSEAQLAEGSSHKVVRLYEYDRKTRIRTTILPMGLAHNDYKPQLSHNGNLLAYFRQYDDRRTELRILDRTTGQDEAVVALVDADDAEYTQMDDSRPNYAFTPDDRSIMFWHAGTIRRVEVVDGSMVTIPFRVTVERVVTKRVKPTVQSISDTGEAIAIRWPSLSRDAQRMAFAAIGYVWVMDVQTGDVRRLTRSDEFEYMPAISPDGQSVAYISFAQSGDEYGSGRLMVRDIGSRKSRELLADSNETYLVPQWSHDGSKIALIRKAALEKGSKTVFGWTPAATGTLHEVASTTTINPYAIYNDYARYVGFDAAGDRLLFSYPQSLTKTVLAATDLDGGVAQTLAISTSEVGGIVPSPDLEHLALTRRDGTVWAVPFDVGEAPVTVTSFGPAAWPVSDNGGYYVDWSDSRQLTFGFGQQVYRYGLQDRALRTRRIGVPFEHPTAAQSIAFTGARLILMSEDVGAGPVIESGTVIVDGARIVALGPASAVEIPIDALVVDAVGKTILPGFLDTHYHRIGGSGFSAFGLPNSRFSDKSAINFGITSAWEPGGPADDGVSALIDLQSAGRIAGPRWSHAAAGGVGDPYELLTSYAAALASVERHRDLGVAVLKEYNVPTREQQQWLLAAARKNELGIVSHLQRFDSTMTRIVDGYSGGDHPSIPVPFYKDVTELLRRTGFIWTPNVGLALGTVGDRKDRLRYYCTAIFQRQKQRDLGTTETDSVCELDKRIPTVIYDAHQVGRVAREVALAAKNGIHIGVSAHNMPGSSLHREMWYLWKGGMAVDDVLRAASIGNAEKLGLREEIGSLEVGKMADFLVLDENPLDDILNTLSLRYTVQGGVVYDSATADPADLSEIVQSQGESSH